MATGDSHSHIPTTEFIDSLKLFQKHPEQFPLDLRAKFCGCTGSKGTSSVCSEYSRQAKLKKLIHQKSGEFISIVNEPNNNLQMLIDAAEELKLTLQSRPKDSRRSSTYHDVDVIRMINFLITNPEKIPIKAVNRLCKITASLSLCQVKVKRTSRKKYQLTYIFYERKK
jgi:hypothetical protein